MARCLWEFARPHTIIGTMLSIVCTFLNFPVPETVPAWTRITVLFNALLCGILINVYIVTVNQYFDVDIDKINKPYLPIAAENIRPRTGLIISLVTLITACVLSTSTRALSMTIATGALLGTLYSVPPIRFKTRAGFMAPASIVFVRTVACQLGIWAHFCEAFQTSWMTMPWPITLLLIDVFFLSCTVAVMKDVPDVMGDAKHGVKSSLSLQHSPQKVVEACCFLIKAACRIHAAVCVSMVVLSLPTWNWRRNGVLCIIAGAHLVWSHIMTKQFQLLKNGFEHDHKRVIRMWEPSESELEGFVAPPAVVEVDFKLMAQCKQVYQWIWRHLYAEFIVAAMTNGLETITGC